MQALIILLCMCMYTGSAAAGTKELDSMKYNSEGRAICSAVESMAEEVQEATAKKEEEEEAES